MISILARKKNSEIIVNVPIENLSTENLEWYWVSIEYPSQEDIDLLRSNFGFHELSIEDCIENMERPKVDHYETYNFFVVHALDHDTLEPNELDLFIGNNFVVSFCKSKLNEVEAVQQKLINSIGAKQTPTYIAYLIFDKIVDSYFPIVYRAEDTINSIIKGIANEVSYNVVDNIYEIRTELLKLRYIINSMKELLYRIVNLGRLDNFKDNERLFNDVYDHLLRLSDMIESNREVTADIRENYISINSHKMNKIMTILTIITSIFIPLSFIVGIYGMNFDYMPELHWKYSYFSALGIMALIGGIMLAWFRHNGWFEIKK